MLSLFIALPIQSMGPLGRFVNVDINRAVMYICVAVCPSDVDHKNKRVHHMFPTKEGLKGIIKSTYTHGKCKHCSAKMQFIYVEPGQDIEAAVEVIIPKKK